MMSITETLSGPMDAFLSFATLAVVKTTVLLAAAAALSFLLRRHAASLRHLLWSLAIAGAVALPVAMASSPFTLHLLPPAPSVVPEDGPSVPTRSRETTVNGPVAIDEAGQTSTIPTFSAPVDADEGFDPRWLFIIWIAGASVLLGRFAAGIARLRGMVSRAAPIDARDWLARPPAGTKTAMPPLRLSHEVDMPFASGLVRPTIVLPASASDWTAERRWAVLQHELAHLSRGDLLMNALSHIARALHWFNPFAWYAAHRVRIESERACDDAVLRQGARPSDYAEHLLSIAGAGAPGLPAAALAMARPSAFEGRLLAILEPGLERTALSRAKVALATLAFLMVVLPLAAASPTAKAAAMAPARPSAPNSIAQDPTPDSQPAPAVRPTQAATAATSAVPALIEALTDSNAEVRLAAIKSLASLQDPRAIAALGQALKEDTDARVRRAAAEALGEIDDSRAVPHLLAALRDERVAEVREAIVDALGEIDDSSAVAGVASVVKDSSVAVRRAAANALDEFEDPAALPVLLSMVRDTDAEVRRNVASALSDLESSQTMDALTALARDSDEEVRSSAINGLGNLEDPRTLSTLVAALRDPSPEVRSRAADAIQNIPDLEKAPAGLIALLTDPNHEVRQNVAQALGGIGDEAAVPALKRQLSDTNADVRRAVAEALSDIGGAEAITALMGLLKDQDPEIRRIAAEALGKRRD